MPIKKLLNFSTYFLLIPTVMFLSTELAVGAVPPVATVTSGCTFSVRSQRVFRFDDKLKAIEAYKIQLKPGTEFAWAILLKTNCKSLRYTEKVTPPGKSKLWRSEDSKTSNSPDGKTVTFDRSEDLQWELINGENLALVMSTWVVSEDDREGIATIEILVDNSPIAKFSIEFVKEK